MCARNKGHAGRGCYETEVYGEFASSFFKLKPTTQGRKVVICLSEHATQIIFTHLSS